MLYSPVIMRWSWRLLAVAAALCIALQNDGAEALALSRQAGQKHHKERHGANHHNKHQQHGGNKGLLRKQRRTSPPVSLVEQKSVSLGERGAAANISVKDTDVYYSAEMLDKLKVVTEQRRLAGEKRFDMERDRLAAAMMRPGLEPTDLQLLNDSMAKVEEFRHEEEAAVDQMYKFYYTTKAALGARGADSPNCSYLVCGENAACQALPNGGTRCVCNNCFKGDGFVCKPGLCGAGSADAFMGAQPLINFRQDQMKPKIQEIHSTAFGDNMVAVVFRDSSNGDRGFVKIGHVAAGGVKWSALQGFSGDLSAFGPVVQGLEWAVSHLLQRHGYRWRGLLRRWFV